MALYVLRRGGHILRDLKKVMEYWHDDAEVMSYCLRLKKIFTDAIIERHKDEILTFLYKKDVDFHNNHAE